MTESEKNLKSERIPPVISQSKISTEANQTGTWRFLRPGYDEKTAPCSAACPAGEDIGRIEMLAAKGDLDGAWETILGENPFPAVCGRVCFHPCEGVCNRGEFDSAIAIHGLERFIGDAGIRKKLSAPVPRHTKVSKRIAVAGAGPAGLSAAYFLARIGYGCDIFEAAPEPGGLLRWGIPQYRLPAAVLAAEIDRIESIGVKIHCNSPIHEGRLEGLQRDYDGLFVGCGEGRPIPLKIPGEELALDGLDFLRQMRQGKETCNGVRTAAVIGGGNTAIDVSRSLLRMGAKKVLLIYRRRREDMPAFAQEVELAIQEGVELVELRAPVRIERKDRDCRLILGPMRAEGTAQDGRARILPADGEEESLDVQSLYRAIGAEPAADWLRPSQKGDVERFSRSRIYYDQFPIIFGGDLTNPTKSVADAIGSGKEAAMLFDTLFAEGREAIHDRLQQCRVGQGKSLSMEMYLSGRRKTRNKEEVPFERINTEHFTKAPRQNTPLPGPAHVIGSFAETEKSFSEGAAQKEAERCFNCGICNDCDNCRLFCPEVSVNLSDPRTCEAAGLNRQIDYQYCKGCGICVVECPRDAMSLTEETTPL